MDTIWIPNLTERQKAVLLKLVAKGSSGSEIGREVLARLQELGLVQSRTSAYNSATVRVWAPTKEGRAVVAKLRANEAGPYLVHC